MCALRYLLSGKTRSLLPNLTSVYVRSFHASSLKFNLKNEEYTEEPTRLEKLVEKYRNEVFYNSVVDRDRLMMTYHQRASEITQKRREKMKQLTNQSVEGPIPLSLKYLMDDFKEYETPQKSIVLEQPPPTHFPYSDNISVNKVEDVVKKPIIDDETAMEVKTRLELYNKTKEHLHWMDDYENYAIKEDDGIEDNFDWKVNYGTPDPKSAISKVPCGGCGALLHCKNTSIPGYIPSEIFKNYTKVGGTDLKTMTCQRCHFLKNYDVALQVRVKAEDYPKILNTIAKKDRGLVVLMVDLLDYPCSIWPGLADIIGTGKPIIVVGNKVDLLPQDGRGYLERIKKHLMQTMKIEGFGMMNIKDVILISAKTGFGVENLITKLYNIWKYKGDVYLLGCTNVGKSSLFNALLQSDYCKSQAADIIQRATTSPWPGTTLNLLKFPILRPSGWKLHVRTKRLISVSRIETEERKLRYEQYKLTKNPKCATLIGRIARTFDEHKEEEKEVEGRDIFSFKSRHDKKIGLDEHEYALSKWCYDTPGVVQPDQLIHLLTTEELVELFPKDLIEPQTFGLRPGNTLFIAGLARLDYLEGERPARFTVFCSSKLPITICKTSDADKIYDELLGTELFSVPVGYPDRLKLWPGLEQSKVFTVKGIDRDFSAADLVLSSAGWVAVTPDHDYTCSIRGWTPEKRGVILRESLLPHSVSLRGTKIQKSCLYRSDKIFK